jgi:hypothetical protein
VRLIAGGMVILSRKMMTTMTTASAGEKVVMSGLQA